MTIEHVPRYDRHVMRIVGCLCGWQCPAEAQDSDDAFTIHAAVAAATKTDWSRVDRVIDLKDDLARKAVVWFKADQAADQSSADLGRLREQAELRHADKDLIASLERVRIDFHLADQRAQRCDEALRQAARALVEALEERFDVGDPVAEDP